MTPVSPGMTDLGWPFKPVVMVAIPAVLLFNWLTAKINGVQLILNRSAGDLLDEIENNHGRTKTQEEAFSQRAA